MGVEKVTSYGHNLPLGDLEAAEVAKISCYYVTNS